MSAPDEPAPPAASTAALTAYALLAIAVSQPAEPLHPARVPLATLAFAVAALAAVRARGDQAARGFGILYAALSALAAVGLLTEPLAGGPPWFAYLWKAIQLSALVLIGVHAAGGPRAQQVALFGLVAPPLLLGLLAPLATPHPMIDVWEWTQSCAHALLGGVHPYTVQAADIYRGRFDFGYTTTVYPYPPLDLLLSTTGVALARDYRYLLASCLVAAPLLLRAASRRLGAPPRLADLACIAFALHPRGPFIVSQGWKEPLLALVLALFVWLHARSPRGPAAAIAFFALPSLKQYVVAPVLLFLAFRPRPRALAAGIAVACALALPFFVWNGRATLDGLLFPLRHTTFRDDSLSLTAFAAHLTGWRAGKALGIAAQLVTGALAFALLHRRGLGGLLLSSALALFASLLLASQAFVNYYYFVGVLLLAAAPVLAARERAP